MSCTTPVSIEAARPRRRYFRFRLRTLLLLPLLFAVAWWWVTWPERTARKFLDLLASGEAEAARAMIDGPQPSDAFWKIATSGKFDFTHFKFERASWNKYALAERQFDFDWQFKDRSSGLGPFVARRNRVRVEPPSDPDAYTVVYEVQNGDAKTIASNLAALYPDDDDHVVRADEDEPKHRIVIAGSTRTHSEIEALIELTDKEAKK